MGAFLKQLTRLVKAPLMIDTTDAEVMEQALTWCQGKSILNSINLDEAQPWQTPHDTTPKPVHSAHTIVVYSLLALTALVAIAGLVQPEADKE